MKKNILKLFAIITIIAGFFIVHQDVFAACTKTNYHTVTFDPVSIIRTGSVLKLKTKVTFTDASCSGLVSDALKDFSFNYTTVGFDNWSEIDIPDNLVPINYNTPIELSVLLPESLNKNAVYQGQFRDNNKEKSSTLTLFWADKANFDPIDIKENSLTSNSVEFDGSVKYENSGAASAGKSVPTRNIVAQIYKKGGALVKEIAFNNTTILKYGQILPLYLKVTELVPDTEYEIRFLDKARTGTDQSFSKPFKTLKRIFNQAGNAPSQPKTYTVVFGDPAPKRTINDVTGTIEFEIPVKYTLTDKTNKSPVTETVYGVIYNKNESKKLESSGVYDPADDVKYNTQSSFGYRWSELTKGNEYVIYFYDKKTETKSPYINLIYTADGLFSSKKISTLPDWTNNGIQNNIGNSPAVGVTQTSSETNINGITTTFTAAPVYITDYSDGMDAVKVNGFVKYTNPNKTISLATAQAGTILVNLLDKNGNVKYVDEISLGNQISYDKDIPLDSTILAVGNSLDPAVNPLPIFKPEDAPFTVKIIETKLDARSKAFTVAMPVKPGAGANNSPNQNGNNPATQSDTKTASNGTTVVFNVDSSELKFKTGADGKQTASAIIHGHLLYSKNVDNDAKINNIQAKIYNSDNRTVSTGYLELDAVTSNDIEFSGTFTELNPDGSPFMFDISDKDIEVVSGKFYINESQTVAAVDQSGAFTPETKTSPVAANGSKVTFTITKSEFTPPGLLNVGVTAAYTKTTNGTDPTAKNITGTLYDNKGNKLMDVPADIYKNKPNTFEISFFDIDPAKGPFTMTLKENDLGVSVSGFKLATIDPASFNNPRDPSDPKDPTKSQYGLLRNPLRKGLDSIPDIVAALVKNIVIPIAIPFLALSIIYTGFLFIQARGNKEKLVKAKEALKWTLIGGAIILASYVIATALQGTIADIIR